MRHRHRPSVVTSATSVVAPATDGRAARVYLGVACDGGGGAGAGASPRGCAFARGRRGRRRDRRGILARRARRGGRRVHRPRPPRAREAHGWTAGARARATRAATRVAPHPATPSPFASSRSRTMATAAPGAGDRSGGDPRHHGRHRGRSAVLLRARARAARRRHQGGPRCGQGRPSAVPAGNSGARAVPAPARRRAPTSPASTPSSTSRFTMCPDICTTVREDGRGGRPVENARVRRSSRCLSASTPSCRRRPCR